MSSTEQPQQQQPVIEIAGAVRHIKTAFAGLSATTDGNLVLQISPESLRALSLTSDKGGAALLNYPKSVFPKWNCNTTLSFGLKDEEIMAVIKRAKDKNAEGIMRMDFENSRFEINFEGKTYKCRLISTKTEIKESKMVPEATVVTSFAEWKELLDDVSLDEKSKYSTPTMFLEVKEGKIRFWTQNKEGTEFETTKGGVPIPKDKEKQNPNDWFVSGESVQTEIAIEKIKVFTKTLDTYAKPEKVTLNIVPNHAMRIDIDEGYTAYWIGAMKDRKQ